MCLLAVQMGPDHDSKVPMFTCTWWAATSLPALTMIAGLCLWSWNQEDLGQCNHVPWQHILNGYPPKFPKDVASGQEQKERWYR